MTKKLTEREIERNIALAKGGIGAAGHVVTDERVYEIIRRKSRGEITHEESKRLILELHAK